MVVVIDTNCLLASIPPQSSYYWLYLAFKEERFEWLISNEIMTEYEEKITSRYSGKTANHILSILSVAPTLFLMNLILNGILLSKILMIINLSI